MPTRFVFAVVAGLTVSGAPMYAQENPVRRVANIVSVAVEEYYKGVDARGRLISEVEYREASEFLADAQDQARRLGGGRLDSARTILDSLIAAVRRRTPPDSAKAFEQRFAAALGREAALELPNRPLDVADGRELYERNCASCHGTAGRGDGPGAHGLKTPPPAIGDGSAMRDRTPALTYRVMSVGIAGTPMVGWAATLTPEQRWNIVAYLLSLRTTPGQVAEGEGLYAQRCAQCHGGLGAGDGANAAILSHVPAEIGTLAWQAAHTDEQIAEIVHDGLANTAMPSARDLDTAQVRSVVAYLRTLPLRNAPAAVAQATVASNEPSSAARTISGLLQQSLVAARAGRAGDASDRAFDAYIAFEPLESRARAKNPGLIATMERLFADFRGAVRAGDVRSAERERDAIEAAMPTVLELTAPPGSGIEAFWQSFLIIVREGLEAILVVGAIVAFLLKTGHRERLRSIWWGVGLAIAASAVTAIILKTVLSAVPASREVIEGITMLIAVAVLFSVSFWLISKVEAAKWQQFIRDKVNEALARGGGGALTFVAFLAVYREGAETALFYQALFNEGSHVALSIALGILLGGAALAVIFTLFYRFGIRIPLRPFFGATSVLLYYMAFVFMGKGLRELQEGNMLPITTIPGAPHAELLGLYPTVETLLGQLLLFGLFVFALLKTFWPRRAVALPMIPADPTTTVLVEAQLAELRAAQHDLRVRLDAIERAVSDAPSRSRLDD